MLCRRPQGQFENDAQKFDLQALHAHLDEQGHA
jgi:hypothetical protein